MLATSIIPFLVRAPDDNFASIVTAVEEGRRVWDNLRKLLVFNLPVNFAQGFTIFFAYVVGFKHAPLTAIQVRNTLLPPCFNSAAGGEILSFTLFQVLYVNLVTAVTMGMMLAAEPAEPNVMSRPPRRPGKRLLGKLVMWRCVFVCAILVCLVLGMFYWAESEGKSLDMCR